MARARGKSTSLLIIVAIVAAYAAVLFIGAVRSTATWIALIFAVLQAVILAASLYRREPGAGGLFRAYPKLAIAAVCFAVQMVVGFAICLVAPDDIAVLAIVGILLLTICCVCVIGSGKAMDYAGLVEQDITSRTDAMSDALLRMNRLSVGVDAGGEAGKLLHEVIEKLRFADQRSTAAVVELDAMIIGQISKIETDDGLEAARLRELSQLIDERSLVLKGSK